MFLLLTDPKVAGAYARQIPRPDADVLTKRNLDNWLTGRQTEDVRWIKDWALIEAYRPIERHYFYNFDDVCSAIRKSVWKSIPFRTNEFGEDIDWAQQVLEAGWKIAYWPKAYVIHSHQRTFRYEYIRNFLTLKKTYEQYGLNTVPTKRNLILSIMGLVKSDWIYAIRNEKQVGKLLKLLIQIPALSFATVYGQYTGIKEGKKQVNSCQGISGDYKMRIVLTVHQFFPDYSSGTEVLTYETAKELQRLGHQVSVFTGFQARTPLKDSDRFDRYIYNDILVERFHYDAVPMGDQTNVYELKFNNHLFGAYFKEYLKREKPDIVHFFHLLGLSASAVDACYELDIPTVLTPTDFWFICPTIQLRLPDNRLCAGPDQYSINCLRHMVTISQPPRVNALVQRMPNRILAMLLRSFKKGIQFDNHYSPLVRAFSMRRESLRERMNSGF